MPAKITVYGLKTCDTCRKALKWLAAEGIPASLHDLRKDGLSAARLDAWAAAFGWEKLLNRRSATWRDLDGAAKDGIDGVGARALMLAHPALIKRPLFDLGGAFALGFGADTQTLLKTRKG